MERKTETKAVKNRPKSENSGETIKIYQKTAEKAGIKAAENAEENPTEDGNSAETNEEKAKAINELGATEVPDLESDIHVITIIGEIEGHMAMPENNKTTKYEHIIPQLVAVEESKTVKGLLIVLNTVGGDVEAGLAIAEMIASMSKPTVSLVLGGGHSIGVPIAVASGKSFIAPTATMTIHPVRLTGMVIGVPQSFDYIEKMQDRVISFITAHSNISAEQFKKYMMNTGELTRDIGTIVVGQAAVDSGLIDEVGGLKEALGALHGMIGGK